MIALPDDEFHAELERRFGLHLGDIGVTRARRAYPLGLFIARSFVADRIALGLDDDQTGQLKEWVNSHRIEAAAALISDTVLERFAVTGSRSKVVARLAELRDQVQPEILLFDADDYSVAFLEDAAAVARDAGAVTHNEDRQDHALDTNRRT